MADLTVISGKTLGGDGGEGVLIESVAVRFDTLKDGKPVATLEITGTAKTALLAPYNPTAGFVELPEPVPVTHSIDVPVEEGADVRDNAISFSQMNRAFDFEDPLVDRTGEWERFLKDSPNSVYKDVIGKRAYYSARLKNAKTGEKVEDYYFNIMGMAKRVEPEVNEVKKRIEAMRKKRAVEKELKEKAMADGGFATSGASDVPF